MARNKTTFRKSTLKLAEALGVEPDEALRIARRFPRYARRRNDETESEASDSMLSQLNECTVAATVGCWTRINYRDAERAITNTIAFVQKHGVEVIPVLGRYRERIAKREAWEESLNELRYLDGDVSADYVDDKDAESIAGEIHDACQRIAHLMKRVHYQPDPNESLGF